MEAFATLLDRLYYTHSNLGKAEVLKDYLKNTPDPDRGYAVAALAGGLSFDLFKRAMIRDIIKERVDPVLYDMSRDYVGETSETVAHIWPVSENPVRLNRIPLLHEVIEKFTSSTKQEIRDYLIVLLDNMVPEQRWALLKLGTQGLRVGVSARFIKNVLADYGNVEVAEVESIWPALVPPYLDLFDWLEGRAPRPDTSEAITFHPVMLSHPLEERDAELINPADYVAEWKYDGIRVQLVSTALGQALFTRTGDDISHTFPDLLEGVSFHAILDGELLVNKAGTIASFNDLQQRLGKKAPSKKLMQDYPAHLMIYDAMEIDGENLRGLSLMQRREKLQQWYDRLDHPRFAISPLLPFETMEDLQKLREQADRQGDNYIEGLMLKRRESAYLIGRPKGEWWKWKRNPLVVDAVLMYAQRGSGKRASFYSDYTFGLWKDGTLLPVGKAYSGYTDVELKKIDNWIRNNTTHRFGPVREVKPEMVFELAFDSVHPSARHKSGYAMRFPRVNRIRWDKPAAEADQMEALEALIQQSPA